MDTNHSWWLGFNSIVTWVVLLFLFLPLFVIFPFSLTSSRYLSLPKDSISFRHYINIFTSHDWLSSIGQSFFIASCTTVIAVILGTMCAIGLWRIASRKSEIVHIFILIPIIIPPIVSALAFYRFWVDLGFLDSYIGMIIAHTILGVPFVVITVSTSLANFDLKLELAARNLGASMSKTLYHIILPNILPGVFGGAIFVFILSWDEIVVTLFITSLNIFTLPRRLWDGIREHADPSIASCAAVLIILTFVAILLYLFIIQYAEIKKNNK